MSNADERRARATEDAAEWLLRFESQTPSDEDQAQFAEWLRESPLHVAEILHASRVQHALMSYAGRGLIAPLDRAMSIAADVVTPMRTSGVELPRLRSRPAARNTWLAAAAAAVVVVLAAAVLLRSQPMSVRTLPGERRELLLADGSHLTVGPDSVLGITLGTHERRVSLQRGEMLLSVAQDPKRPLWVDAGGIRTRDVGTTFSIERREDQVVVTVVEGRVTVSPAQPGGRFQLEGSGAVAAFSLTKDEQVTVLKSDIATPVHKVVGQVETSWARGQLIFDDARADDIAHRLNQFNRIQIRISDVALAARRITGVFRADDPKSFAELLSLETGSRFHLGNNGDIIMDSSTAPAGVGSPP